MRIRVGVRVMISVIARLIRIRVGVRVMMRVRV